MYSSYGTKLKLQVRYMPHCTTLKCVPRVGDDHIGQIYKVCKNKEIKTMLINKSK